MCPGQVGIFGDIDKEAKWAQNSRFSEFLQRPEALNGASGIGWLARIEEGKLVQDKDISVSAPDCCQSKENHLRGKFQQGKIFWNSNCRKYVARTRGWLLTKPLLVSFTPRFFGSEFRQQSLNNQQCSGISCFKMDETKYCWKAGFSSPLSDSFNKWFHRHLV